MSGISWVSEVVPGRRRLFYFTTPDHALDNLREGQIKVSSFEKCNDLFELASVDLSEKRIRAEHRVWLSKVSSSVGLICLSEDWRSTLMWGYYTGNGSGLCLVVDVDPSDIHPVQYVGKREKLTHSSRFPEPSDGNFRAFSATKSFHWSHEKEHRFFVNFDRDDLDINEIGPMKFLKMQGKVDLAGIINGPRAANSKTEIFSAIGSEVPFFQCRPAFREFRMVMQRNQDLWK